MCEYSNPYAQAIGAFSSLAVAINAKAADEREGEGEIKGSDDMYAEWSQEATRLRVLLCLWIE